MLIGLLGDVMLGRLVNERLRRVGADYPWGDTDSVLRQADLTIANLECVLAAGGEPQAGKVFHFRSDPKNVASLRVRGDRDGVAGQQPCPGLRGRRLPGNAAGARLGRHPACRRRTGPGRRPPARGAPRVRDRRRPHCLHRQPAGLGSGRRARRLLRAGGGQRPQGGGPAGAGPADEGPRPAPDRLRALGAELGLRGAVRAPRAGAGTDRGGGRRRLRAFAAHLPRRRAVPGPADHLQRRGLCGRLRGGSAGAQRPVVHLPARHGRRHAAGRCGCIRR